MSRPAPVRVEHRLPNSATSEDSNHILDVRDLVKHFGGVKAVDRCSFSVPRGELVGLIGPNGAGKSTVVEIISGAIKPNGGQIVFDGRQIQGLAPHDVYRAGISRCFQLAELWPKLTVLENLLIAAPTRHKDSIRAALFSRRRLRAQEKEHRDLALASLDRYGLFPVRNNYAYTLSGGQRRLLEFARIAMSAPKFALLDEPMAGVNPVLRQEIEDGIGTFLDEGMTVLLIEHNLAFIERLCHKIVVMVEGRVAAVGTMADLRNNPVVQDAYLGAADGN